MLNGAELVKPGEERWDAARGAWNLAVDQSPAMVTRPGNADEVAAVVNFARESGLRVAVQAEGHGAGPLSALSEDTLLLKTRRMTGAELDADKRRVRVGAAAKWRDVSALASPAGLAPLAGSSAEVGWGSVPLSLEPQVEARTRVRSCDRRTRRRSPRAGGSGSPRTCRRRRSERSDGEGRSPRCGRNGSSRPNAPGLFTVG